MPSSSRVVRRRATISIAVATAAAVAFVVTAQIAGGTGSPPAAGASTGTASGTPSATGKASVSPTPGATGTATGPGTVSADGSVTSPPAPQTSTFTITRLKPGQKPPQFVIVAFDGSADVDQLTDWARITASSGSTVSYFVSGVYLLTSDQRMKYHAPQRPPGVSSIGFAHPQNPIDKVTGLLNAAYLAGNDIGTHFNGHFCGSTGVNNWSEADWTNEIQQWNGFIDHWKSNNGITDAPPMSFDHTVSVGGRTPCLEGKPAAYLTAMSKLGYRYDTSATGELQWPSKTTGGLWEFPLPTVRWMGAKGGFELSMDYNLWYHYNKASKIHSDAERVTVEKNVYDTYLAAFNATYSGNRAPLFFGNHMNYWGCNAAYTNCDHTGSLTGDTPLQHYGPFTAGLQRAYVAMCSKPDVQCISYKQMADWLDAQSPAVVAALRAQGAVSG